MLTTYLYPVIFFICLYINSKAQNTLTLSNATLHPYHERPDSISRHGRDTVWGSYMATFVASDTSQIGGFYICVGSGNDSADILLQKVNIIRDDKGRNISVSKQRLPITRNVVPAIIRIRYADIPRINTIKYYIEDRNGHLIGTLSAKK